MTTKQELIVELDSTLIRKDFEPSSPDWFNEQVCEKNNITVRDCILGPHRHRNYLNYLQRAWGSHYGIVISPDIIWHILLSEMGVHIKNNSEFYRTLFTASDKKVEIVVPTADPQLIDLNLIVTELKKLVPTNIDLFLPEFTSTTASSSLAFMAVFADAMTPYYNYCMYLCGIPKIKILGEKSDWEKIITNLTEMKVLLNKNKKNADYFDKVIEIVEKITGNYEMIDVEFLKNIFSLKRCGSGGQVEASGWATDLFMKKPQVRYVENYPTCISKVPYTLLETQQKFELCYGLFSSVEEDGFIIPDFGFIINEIKTK